MRVPRGVGGLGKGFGDMVGGFWIQGRGWRMGVCCTVCGGWTDGFDDVDVDDDDDDGSVEVLNDVCYQRG